MAAADGSPLDRPTLVAGALAGAGAYATGYLVLYLAAAARLRESLAGRVLDATGAGVWKAVGWLFYNAHFVDAVGSFSAFGVTLTNSVSLVGEVVSPLAYALPPLLLVAAGLAAARTATLDGVGAAALAGATVVVGYLPLAVLGAPAFGVAGDAGTAGPALWPAVVLAGVVYPAVFGAAGGLLARGAA
ncbi:MAG: hypothetical protein ABEH77_10115 [Halobacteriaceae archaeon]